jgi:D-sedoheptulose 7-phosphate isomerase
VRVGRSPFVRLRCGSSRAIVFLVSKLDLGLWRRALADRADLLTTLADGPLGAQVIRLADLVGDALTADRKVLIFGNGGSAALAQHVAAELVGRFEKERKALSAVALTTDLSILTAVANDYGYDRVFERQIEGLAQRGDVAIALSTSGRSPNVLLGLRAATRRGARTAALLGQDGGPARRLAGLSLVVPASRVSLIQEVHELIVHVLCEELDRRLARPRTRSRQRPRRHS